MHLHFLHHRHRHAFHFGRHHRGFQGFGFGPGQLFGDEAGRGGVGAGRKLNASDLQLLILALLAEKPSHGYEVIKSLDERSNGYYSPSPGMVYPALTYLDEIGHATVETDGAKKRYSITKDGVAHLEANRAAVDTLLEQLAWIGRRMSQVRQAFSGSEGPDGAEDFDEPRAVHGRGHADRHDFGVEIRRARRSLKSALIAKFGSPADEQQRIAEILERAAREIRGE